MKVAFVRYKYDPYGGAERFTQVLMDALTERGVGVHLFAREWTEAGRAKVHLHRIGGPSWPSLLRHASFVFLVGRAVRKQDFDLIQSNERTLCQHLYRAGDGVHARWLELRALQQGRLQRLLVQANPFHHYLLWLERRLFEHPDLKAVIVNSDMVSQEITSRFRISPECIHIIYNGVDLKRFRPEKRQSIGEKLRAECGLDRRTPVVLFVGSGFERKGLAALLRGMALAGGDAQLWVVGKGKARLYQDLARRLGLQRRVTFWGPQDDVLGFYAAADIFALPTIYDPFPTSVLEAMASGLPVITTAQCGAAEIMIQGKHGFILSAPGATEELADYLRFLYQPENRRPMSLLARMRAQDFPMERTVRELQELYQLILERLRL
jgi:UDP-glucose:(heptosyl)LPS alpha-1,3-glucosyltransferase